MIRQLPGPISTKPGDFEQFVRRLAGVLPSDNNSIRRLGSELMTEWDRDEAQGGLPRVPADYTVAPGDELIVTMWGSVDADLRLVVDRSGQIAIPRVGSVQVAGVRYADLTPLLTRRVGAGLPQLRAQRLARPDPAVRVYVTGFVDRPAPTASAACRPSSMR